MKEECDRLKKPISTGDIENLSKRLEAKIEELDTKISITQEMLYYARRKEIPRLIILSIFLWYLVYYFLNVLG